METFALLYYQKEFKKMTEITAEDISNVSMADTKPEKPAPSQPQTSPREKEAMKIVKRHMLFSGGIGLIPAPFFDQVAIAGVLAKMLNDLSKLYGLKFSDHKIKAIVASVLGGAHSDWITYYIVNYLSKLAPGINAVGNFVTRPIISAAITFAIGKLFVFHFESGSWVRVKEPKLFQSKSTDKSAD
jgi:uncharacterized protein (DUF697 family)